MKWNVEDTFSWLRRDHSASKEDYMVSVPLTCGLARGAGEGAHGDGFRSFWRWLPLLPLAVCRGRAAWRR